MRAGELLVAAVKKLDVCWSPDLAEAGVAAFGVKFANRLGYRDVELECDAINVVQAVNSKHKGATPIYLFYEDIIRASLDFNSFICKHVKRGENVVAHCVARWETTYWTERICMSVFPQSLVALVDLI
ncbi:uncharacterized protein LOC110726597 [Chenopodium quinoa]|uniref:uncharacterized protein LOC110697025 n=1 Tax=Chenopodium quinoa TaxID=63459 RepID=UPI000B7740C4|nr:uncharacterized protein LOC110697025 [Chenopodium quinoa]XP_021730052.1 uncharacterized protein LOC110697026 [Chenopodium quinoa]XP_021736172.1 uncharacterized protein LOC110702728 [Chenopodium quinoa]XP_021761769.1 uncharacterized protein LOC110726597 [Chenopodium quinoa]